MARVFGGRRFDQFAGVRPGVLRPAFDEEVGEHHLGRRQVRIRLAGLLEFLEAFFEVAAKERGATTILALSTQSFGFFTNVVGFEEASKEVLPEALMKLNEESGGNG